MLQRAMLVVAAVLSWLGHATAQPLPPVPEPLAASGRDHPLAGQLVRLVDGAHITPAGFVQVADSRDFVLLGEKHDNIDHHRLQAWVIDALVAIGRRPVVAMEMLDADQAAALATHLRDRPDDVAGLGSAIGWSERGWPDWSIYAPIAHAAMRAGLPIVPADLTRANRRAVGRAGAAGLDRLTQTRLGQLPEFDTRQSASLMRELRDSHCGELPEEAVPRMMDVQRARDAHMAQSLLDAVKLEGTKGAVLIAGSGHVRVDRGVPWHLRQSGTAHSYAVLAFVEVDDARRDVADYDLDERFQYVWFTPRVDDEDPCVKFRDSLRRLRRP